MQYLFVVEAKSNRHDSDYLYIRALYKEIYMVDNGIRIRPIYMNGKGNYKNIKSKIDNAIEKYADSGSKDKNSVVIYCIDVDDRSGRNAVENNKLNNSIKEYCKTNGYELIWFNKDIEDVFIGKQIDTKLKTKTASDFSRHGFDKSFSISNLCNENVSSIHTSNIMCVLDKLLKRKK